MDSELAPITPGVYPSTPRVNAAQASMSAREPVLRWSGREHSREFDDLAVEEPLQIRLAGEDVAVTMRTPGHDEELAAGFLYTEGIIRGRHHIGSIAYCPDREDPHHRQNVINVLPTDRALLEPRSWGRDFISSSSCGLCGKTSIEQIVRSSQHALGEAEVSLETLYSLGDKLRDAQTVFAQTGGVHAAALFDVGGNPIVLREDVGRHNAVDKVIGRALLDDILPLSSHILVVSSRASFEIVQKALMAGVAIVAAVSAPSSLAVQLAREANLTLVAFLRPGRLNVYAAEWRIGD